jgi:hypothetical protein
MRFNYTQNKLFKNERGQILALALILMCLGVLVITPLLIFMGSSMQTTHQVFNTKADELYAADAGIVDAQWNIKYDNLASMFSDYDPFDYTHTYDSDPNHIGWNYDLSEQVNTKDVNVTISNEWMLPDDILPPSPVDASNIRSNLVVIGSADNPITISSTLKVTKYHIKFTFFPQTGDILSVNSIGVWLPQGYEYYSDSTHKSSPEGYSSSIRAYPGSPYDWRGNKAVQWEWSTPLLFTSIPGAASTSTQISAEVTFYIKPPQDRPNDKPDVVAWITTEGADLDGDGDASGTHFSWNQDVKVYKIASSAGGTSIDSYIAQVETQSLQSAIGGDYYATGNSLMRDSNHDGYIRDTLDSSSSAIVATVNIPDDSDIAAAYLYWSGFKTSTTTVFSDAASSFSPNWDPGANSSWSLDTNLPNSFKGNFITGMSRNLTLNRNKADLSGTSPGTVNISWDYWYTLNEIPISPLLPDSCVNFNNWTRNGSTPYTNTAWGADAGNTYFRGHSGVSSPPAAYYNLTLTNQLSLSAYASGTVNISWKMWKEGSPTSSEYLYLDVSNNNFSSYSTIASIRGNNISATSRPTTNNFSYAIPSSYITNSCKVRFRLSGYSTSGKYCDIDDITVSAGSAPGSGDGLDFTLSSDGDNFPTSSLIHAYTGTSMTNGSSNKKNYSYSIPTAYLTSDFRIKFALVGFANSNCHIDNIQIVAMQADKTCTFSIGGTQMSFDADGDPQIGGTLNSTKSQILANNPGEYSYSSYCDVTALVRSKSAADLGADTNYPGHYTYTVGGVDAVTGDEWSYAGWSLILVYTGPGTRGHQLYLFDNFVYSDMDTNVDFDQDGTAGGDINGFLVPPRIRNAVLSVAITSVGSGYTSAPQVNLTGGGGTGAVAVANISGGHITSISVLNGGSGYTSAPIVSFTTSGSGSGASATATVGDELNAAKMTVFVGEGDNAYTNDYVRMKTTKLWDGTSTTGNSKSSPNNVWNSNSIGLSADGVDIDTLGIDPAANPPQYITWGSGILNAGDTSVHVDLQTGTDSWNLVYVILSFRSATTTGGALSYLIH